MSFGCPSDKASTSVGVEFGVETSGIDEVFGRVGEYAELGAFGSAVVDMEVPVVVVVVVEVIGCKIELGPEGDS